jgi:hypothetical protein
MIVFFLMNVAIKFFFKIEIYFNSMINMRIFKILI